MGLNQSSNSSHSEDSSGTTVEYLDSLAAFNATLDQCKKEGKLLVIDYTASWCGPCQYIAPIYEAMSNHKKFKDKVVFMKVDSDTGIDVLRANNIRCFPTFKIYRDGAEVNELRGANQEKLDAFVSKEMEQTTMVSPALVTANA